MNHGRDTPQKQLARQLASDPRSSWKSGPRILKYPALFGSVPSPFSNILARRSVSTPCGVKTIVQSMYFLMDWRGGGSAYGADHDMK